MAEKSKKFYKLKTVPYVENGVDLSRMTGDKSLSNRKYDVAVIGRFTYQKNHEFLIKAFAKIHNSIPNFKVALIGGGELFENMQNLSKSLNCDFVDFLGTMPNPGIILDDSKIVALGSRFEANPLSLLEGMAAGCIVVSSNVGGISNIIKNDNGYLFELDDEETFVNIVVNILNNIGDFEAMSKNNINYSKNFSMEKCAQNYLNVFESYLYKQI